MMIVLSRNFLPPKFYLPLSLRFAADSIICFTCERQPTNWKCLQMTICPDNENACLTMRDVDETGESLK
uniref:Snake toxin/toxin-like domain-containing protein n=1 Tax=Podarcis muralis TaxID=64176 RepID=A0A670I9J0_PODMU